MSAIVEGACFRGEVRLEVAGDPALQGFRHCPDCRKWSAPPVTAYALWPSADVRVTAGGEHLREFSRDGKAIRRHCTECGGAVMTESPAVGMTDVY